MTAMKLEKEFTSAVTAVGVAICMAMAGCTRIHGDAGAKLQVDAGTKPPAAAGARPQVDAWEARRAAAVNRPRTLVYNTDGGDAAHWPTNLAVTPANFASRRLKYVLGTCATTVSYCPLSSGFGHFICRKAGEPYAAKTHRGEMYAAGYLFEQGTDPLEIATRFCRTNSLEVFVSIRVNDTHDAAGKIDNPDPLFPDFKKNNPDCLMGRNVSGQRPKFCNWSAVDFAQEKVRAHMRRFVRDLVSNYDVDGIEYDFNRHAQLFKSVSLGGEASKAELDLMTGFMRELKGITEEVGRRKNHPIVIFMRAPDSAGYCKAIGIDLERWFDEKLVDAWIGSGYFRLNPWSVSAALAHRYGIKFYASLDESRVAGVAKRKKLPVLPGRQTPEFYTARFADAMASGCDGVYVFNLEGGLLNRVCSVDPRKTDGLATIRFAVGRGSGGYRPWKYLKDGGRFSNMPKIDPGEPLVVKPGETCAFSMLVAGDSLKGGMPAVAYALTNLKDGMKIAFSCNGRRLEPSAAKGGLFTYRLPDGVLKAGTNDFAVEFPADAPPKTTFNDFSIRIKNR